MSKLHVFLLIVAFFMSFGILVYFGTLISQKAKLMYYKSLFGVFLKTKNGVKFESDLNELLDAIKKKQQGTQSGGSNTPQ